MGRSRYKVYEPTHPHFITCTVLHWIPLFTRQESVDILFESFGYLQKNDNFKLFAYVILENHLHMIATSDDISQSIKKFKSYTAKALLELLQLNRVQTILDQLAFYKKAHKTKTSYQVWQEGSAFKLIQSEAMMIERINYIHNNPLKRGYVDEAAHWRYSSARNYVNKEGLIDVARMW